MITHMAVVEARDGFVPCGAEGAHRASRIGTAVEACSDRLGPMQGPWRLPEVPERYDVPDAYMDAFSRPLFSDNHHLRLGGSRWRFASAVDWWTFLPTAIRENVMDALFGAFRACEAARTVSERSDIPLALEQAFPLIGQHGLDAVLEERIWRWLRRERREQLSAYSRRAVENGDRGKRFEDAFRDYCTGAGLRCWKRSARAFAAHVPDVFRRVRERAEGMAGIPDFFVDKGNTHTLDAWSGEWERSWAPAGRYAFVECKYGGSRLSTEQRAMVELLQEEGVEVVVFRGDMEEQRFEVP